MLCANHSQNAPEAFKQICCMVMSLWCRCRHCSNDNNYAIWNFEFEKRNPPSHFHHTKTTNYCIRFCDDFYFRYYCFCVCAHLKHNLVLLAVRAFFSSYFSPLCPHAVTSHAIVRMENDAEQLTADLIMSLVLYLIVSVVSCVSVSFSLLCIFFTTVWYLQ